MSKKSALTAALSGAPPPETSKYSAAPKALAGLGNLDAFPCLFHAPDDGTALETLAEGIDSIDISKVHVVGSVPTNTLAPNGKQLVGPRLPWFHCISPWISCLDHGVFDHHDSSACRLTTLLTRIDGVGARRACLQHTLYLHQLVDWQ